MFCKIFTVSFLLAFFVMATNCSQYPYPPTYNDNDLYGQAGGNGGGAIGEIQSRGPSINKYPNRQQYNDNDQYWQAGRNGGGAIGEVQSQGPSINVNPVNNAVSNSGAYPNTNQNARAIHGAPNSNPVPYNN